MHSTLLKNSILEKNNKNFYDIEKIEQLMIISNSYQKTIKDFN